MFTITITQGDTVISTHTAASLEAAHMDLITDGLPVSTRLGDALDLLGQITEEGGTIHLPDGALITVTPDAGAALGVACGSCGGNLLMATCDMFRGSGHDWVLVSVCMVCRAAHWTSDGCVDCKEALHA